MRLSDIILTEGGPTIRQSGDTNSGSRYWVDGGAQWQPLGSSYRVHPGIFFPCSFLCHMVFYSGFSLLSLNGIGCGTSLQLLYSASVLEMEGEPICPLPQEAKWLGTVSVLIMKVR